MNQLRIELTRLSGVQVDDESWAKIQALHAWLVDEAIPAGGLGPNEAQTVGQRHLLDSALYSAAWAQPPAKCWDLGTGVGLPGLILAILWPQTEMVLIDRSQKRIDLTRRAARVAELTIETITADIRDLRGPFEAVVSRAAIPAKGFFPLLQRLLAPGGKAVVSGSGQVPPGFTALEVDLESTILDPAPRLLMMQNS